MPNQFIDMHIHSTASDGTSTPAQCARLCKEAGLKYCALTDHDTMGGVQKFLSEAKKLGLNALPAVEFNTEYDGELHILGYGLDMNNAKLKAKIQELEQYRSTRAGRMVKKLNDNGVDISLERVQQIAGTGVLGRPHIAAALLEKGYVNSISDGFKKYISKGCVGYIDRVSISRKDAISLIKGAGGLAIFAHPGITNAPDTKAMLKTMLDEGIDGIEVYYPTHTDLQVEEYKKIAKEFGLYITCGSDYHGRTRPEVRVNEEKRGDEHLARSVREIFDKFKGKC